MKSAGSKSNDRVNDGDSQVKNGEINTFSFTKEQRDDRVVGGVGSVENDHSKPTVQDHKVNIV